LKKEFRLIFANNGLEGFNKASEVIPDLVISDVMMPVKDGFELCEMLKQNQKTSHIPIILLTALADSKNKKKGLYISADDYLIKPFDIEELKIRVKNLIEVRKMLREKISNELNILNPESKINGNENEFLKKVINITDERLSDQKFGVNELAKDIGWSRETLYRKLKALTGQTAEKFIYKRRIQHAALMLKDSDLTITEIAQNFGFSSPSHFAKHFRKYYNISPRNYRKENSNMNSN
jgi:YesN/AraC family two-component response regulator